MRTCVLLVMALFAATAVEAGEGYDAGYEWAEDEGADDESYCYSSQPGRWAGDNINNSPSFTQGCLDYVEELEAEEEDEEEDEDEDW